MYPTTPTTPPLHRLTKLLLAAALCFPFVASAQTVNSIPLPSLAPNTRFMFWGDSITETAPTPLYVETYLLACAGRKDIKMCTSGHSGAGLGEFLNRGIDLQCFKPTIVLFNYGMNDTQYHPYTATTGSNYNTTMQQSLAFLTGTGITPIVAGPGNVDDTFDADLADASTYFSVSSTNANLAYNAATQSYTYNGQTAAQGQNVTLGNFSAFGRADALSSNSTSAVQTYVSDIFDRMQVAYAAAEAANGPTYSYGVHSTPNGCILMAYEDLKTLSCSGSIGAINVNMNGGATASAGHTVVSASNGVVTLDSTQYPFCYNYDTWYSTNYPNSSIASMLPFVPFSQDLNRLVLTVTNLSGSANVTWGGVTKGFSSAQLAAGVNLADQFSQTPFDATFAQVVAAISYKQQFENFMIKGTSNYFGNDNGGNVDENMIAIQSNLDASVKALIAPVRHTIIIVPAGTSGPAAPVITGTMMAYPTVGYPFSYQVTTFNSATSITATGLPANGLSMNSSGLITGTPLAAGTSVITLTAANASGSNSTTLTLTTQAPIPNYPSITSANSVTATVGQPFYYQITATNSPTNYFVTVQSSHGTEPPETSLPPGLTYNSTTGLFSGTPTATGTFSNSVQVAAMNGAGVSSMLITLTINPVSGGGSGSAPGTPSGLTATAGNTQIDLTWTAVLGATSYNIFRGTSPGGESTTAVASGVTTAAYTDTALTNGTTYYYTVAAVNSSGTSGNSTEASATPTTGVPGAPSGLAAVAGNAQVSLTWTAGSGAATYSVYRGTTSGGEGATPVSSGITSLFYLDEGNGLSNGTTYYYKVIAVNTLGNSGSSNEASATPTSGTGGGGAGSSVVSVQFNSNSLSSGSAGFVPETIWNHDQTSTSYVAPGTSALSNLTDSNNSVTGISETTINDGTYGPNGTYTGFSNPGDNVLFSHGFLSGEQAGTTPPYTFTLNLTGLNAANTYDLILYTTSVQGTYAASTITASTAGGATYYYTSAYSNVETSYVQATNTTSGTYPVANYVEWTGLSPSAGALSASLFSNNHNGQTVCGFQLVAHSAAAPSTPTGLTAGPGTGAGQIALIWTTSTGAQNYLLQRSTVAGSGYTTLATVAAPAVTYTDTDPSLVAGQNYYYQIAAVNSSGTSAFSSAAVGTPYVPATYSGWAYTYFGLSSPSSETVDTADPAHDGLSNLVKYALGLDPLTPATFQPTLTRSGATWQYTFQHPANLTDITYAVQVSPDLSSWTASGVTLTRTATGNPETWQATYTPATGSKLFFRLQITWQ